jgi:hypothetical protein
MGGFTLHHRIATQIASCDLAKSGSGPIARGHQQVMDFVRTLIVHRGAAIKKSGLKKSK